MASKLAGPSTIIELEKSNKFQRLLSLQFECGIVTLRRCIEKELEQQKTSLKDHLKIRILAPPFKKIVDEGSDYSRFLTSENPSLSDMDISLLTLLLCSFKSFQRGLPLQNVIGLRKIRNKVAHMVNGQIENDILFNKTKRLILDIAKTVSKDFQNAQKVDIEEIESRELVRTRSNSELVMINGEQLMVKLVECSEESPKVDRTMLIRLGLTKWAKQISRRVDLRSFLPTLKEEDILTYTDIKTIQQIDDTEEQGHLLVLKLLHDRDDVVLRFCKHLRTHNRKLADLVENNNSEGKDTESALCIIENKKIEDILFDKVCLEETQSIKSEDIHIFVETELGWSIPFNTVEENICKCFKLPRLKDNETRFAGICFKQGLEKPANHEPVDTAISETQLEHFPFNEFVNFMCDEFEDLRPGLGDMIKQAITEESISSQIFATMTEKQLEEEFSKYLINIKYGIGIKTRLKDLQHRFKPRTRLDISEDACVLRAFDTPAGNILYSNNHVIPDTGNLLIPVHHFVNCPRKVSTECVVNEVVSFSAACLNTRQNGTVHFGIERLNEGIGFIKGTQISTSDLNLHILKGIEMCFEKESVHIVQRCVRPTQMVRVENGGFVIEIDIVPYSGHTQEKMFPILYPPKGKQKTELFVYSKFEILPVSSNKRTKTNESYMNVMEERFVLEKSKLQSTVKDSCIEEKFVKTLTGGNEFITDEFTPIICSDNISGCVYENEIRKALVEMESAFLSSQIVFDFDSSVTIRDKIEGQKTSFRIKLAHDYSNPQKDPDQLSNEKIWLYCNGNDEHRHPQFDQKTWCNERLKSVQNAVNKVRELIPKNRALFIFLVFDDKPLENNPMYEIARDCLISTFKNECIVISQGNAPVQCLKDDLNRRLGNEIDKYFQTDLPWNRIGQIMKTLFRYNSDVEKKLPHSAGHFVEMTTQEREDLHIKDIEIVSGTECKPESERTDSRILSQKKEDEEKRFYQGNPVSWWNFFFKDQVGERFQFRIHRSKIEDKMSKNEDDFIKIHEIQHQPGAGGSTLGMHLLWYFSQFDVRGSPSKTYRCCVVKSITEDTAAEVDKVRNFKDDQPNPIMVLIDNKSEESINLLKGKLSKIAYKTVSPEKFYCLLIIINRVSMQHDHVSTGSTLGHVLNKEESLWFKTKYKILEEKDIDVDTLIAFNVMRNSFKEEYIRELIQHVLKDVKPKEKELLKCLSLINSFENDQLIPQSAFDSLMNELSTTHDANIVTNLPFGIAHTFNQRSLLENSRQVTWNIPTTNALRLLVSKRQDDFRHSGICIISRPLAKAILEYIMQTQHLSLEEIVSFVLTIVQSHVAQKNTQSKKFVKLVNSLLKTRQVIDADGMEPSNRTKFSDLVLELEKLSDGETNKEAQARVVRIMTKCFKITSDPYVGQHLARFNIYINDFEAAEQAIKQSLEQTAQQNMCLFDTYGQLFKSKMETIIEQKSQSEGEINDADAADIIQTCFNALAKFKHAQYIASPDDDAHSYLMEVRTAVALLEKFDRFKCFDSRKTFIKFLNSPSAPTILKNSEHVDELRTGSQTQIHLEESLRVCEERDYQVKTRVYTIYTKSNESLLLKLRERFECFYGNDIQTSKLQFTYGLGLKPLMIAEKKEKEKLVKRFDNATISLTRCGIKNADQRDLLIVLGYNIIRLSSTSIRKRAQLNIDYTQMLLYSSKLVELQHKSSRRPFLEAYLYHALLHWPTQQRIEHNRLSPPKSYENYLREWNKAYEKNHEIRGSKFAHKPKNFFALGNGKAGDDIIDLEAIRKQWRKKKQKNEGRNMKPVYKDHFWKEPFVTKQLERLQGTVDDEGYKLAYDVRYTDESHTFTIKPYYPCCNLSNRVVTFVLGFTWKGLTALDVCLKDASFNSNSEQGSHLETNTAVGGSSGGGLVPTMDGWNDSSISEDSSDGDSDETHSFERLEHKDEEHQQVDKAGVKPIIREKQGLPKKTTAIKDEEHQQVDEAGVKPIIREKQSLPKKTTAIKGLHEPATTSDDVSTDEYSRWQNQMLNVIDLHKTGAIYKSKELRYTNKASDIERDIYSKTRRTEQKSKASKKQKRRENLTFSALQTTHLASNNLQNSYEAKQRIVSDENAHGVIDQPVMSVNKRKTLTKYADGADLFLPYYAVDGRTSINNGKDRLREKRGRSRDSDKAAALFPLCEDWKGLVRNESGGSEHEESRQIDLDDGHKTKCEDPLLASDAAVAHTSEGNCEANLQDKRPTSVASDEAAALLPLCDDWKKIVSDESDGSEHEQSRHKHVEDESKSKYETSGADPFLPYDEVNGRTSIQNVKDRLGEKRCRSRASDKGEDPSLAYDAVDAQTSVENCEDNLQEKRSTSVASDEASTVLSLCDDWEELFSDASGCSEHEESHRDLDDGHKTKCADSFKPYDAVDCQTSEENYDQLSDERCRSVASDEAVNMQPLHETVEDGVSGQYHGSEYEKSKNTANEAKYRKNKKQLNEGKVQHTLTYLPQEQRMAPRPTSSRKKRNRLAKTTSSYTK